MFEVNVDIITHSFVLSLSLSLHGQYNYFRYSICSSDHIRWQSQIKFKRPTSRITLYRYIFKGYFINLHAGGHLPRFELLATIITGHSATSDRDYHEYFSLLFSFFKVGWGSWKLPRSLMHFNFFRGNNFCWNIFPLFGNVLTRWLHT